jgi:hypothetical protein
VACAETTALGESGEANAWTPAIDVKRSFLAQPCDVAVASKNEQSLMRELPTHSGLMWLAGCGGDKHACFFCNARSEDGEWV